MSTWVKPSIESLDVKLTACGNEQDGKQNFDCTGKIISNVNDTRDQREHDQRGGGNDCDFNS